MDGQDTFGAGPSLYFPIRQDFQDLMERIDIIDDTDVTETASAVTGHIWKMDRPFRPRMIWERRNRWTCGA